MLHNIELPSNEFVTLLFAKIDKLKSHHFISKSQSRFSRELKSNFPLNQCLLQGDFTQNYSMSSQDSTQSSLVPPPPQCALHTFIAYINVYGKIISHSMCVFSNDMTHNTVAVHTFLKLVIKQIFLICPTLEKIIHFTDGPASLYKKFKNFSNLLCHLEDFKVAGEWHFFAASHGKGPCDGIGGTLKRLARRASLQETANIQTPESLYNWCHTNVTNIHSFYVPSSEIEETKNYWKTDLNLLSQFVARNHSIRSFLSTHIHWRLA